LLEEVYVYQSNYKLQSLALWVPLATIEFAILDMLGRIAKKPMGLLIGDKIYNPTVSVYRANGERDVTAEAVMVNLKKQVEESQAKALKIKIGGRMSHTEFPAGRSEKLIPMVRKEFGDKMVCMADSNGSYGVEEAIRFCSKTTTTRSTRSRCRSTGMRRPRRWPMGWTYLSPVANRSRACTPSGG
jgi:L-alanine-DL-glutamate epimerase-like enolase superfamily enzyme